MVQFISKPGIYPVEVDVPPTIMPEIAPAQIKSFVPCFYLDVFSKPVRGKALTDIGRYYGIKRRFFGLESDKSLRRRIHEAITAPARKQRAAWMAGDSFGAGEFFNGGR